MARISVIIPAYNSRENIIHCLEALSNQTLPQDQYEIIVADDGSLDNTGGIAADLGALVVRQDHAGPASARNNGARSATGDILLFTDSDCVPKPDWVERMVEAFRDPEIAGVKGLYLTRQRRLIPRFVQAEFEEKYDNMKRATYIDFVDTYSAGYRREVFFDNGGFDPSLAAIEDIDFCIRLFERGYKMILAPEAIVYHSHPATLSRYLRRKFRLGQWYARVYARFPGKMLKDSYSPQSVRFQILFSALLVTSLIVSFFWPVGLLALPILALAFVASTFSLSARAFVYDRPVALIVPPVVFLRSVAQLLGLISGGIATLSQREGRSQILGRMIGGKT